MHWNNRWLTALLLSIVNKCNHISFKQRCKQKGKEKNLTRSRRQSWLIMKNAAWAWISAANHLAFLFPATLRLWLAHIWAGKPPSSSGAQQPGFVPRDTVVLWEENACNISLISSCGCGEGVVFLFAPSAKGDQDADYDCCRPPCDNITSSGAWPNSFHFSCQVVLRG